MSAVVSTQIGDVKIETKRVSFWGHSDDLIEIEGDVTGAKEYSVNPFNAEGAVHGRFLVGGVLRVYAIYDGCWSFAVGQVDEDVPFPDWRICVTRCPNNHYSALLEIDLPKGHQIIAREEEG